MPRDFYLKDYKHSLYVYSLPNDDVRQLYTEKAFLYDRSAMRDMSIKELNMRLYRYIEEKEIGR